ncbi:hypothetical protein ACP4OV_025432 [Aristida adscensionis]
MMEVRASSEQGVMAGREPLPFGLPKSPPAPPAAGGALQSVRMAYTTEGTPFFTPVSSAPPPAAAAAYQHASGGASGPGNGAAALPAGGAGEPAAKKKRGRPRKYGPEGAMSLALVPSSVAAAPAPAAPGASGPFSPEAAKSPGTAPSASPDGAKKRGRPKGSTNKKKHMSALGDFTSSTGAGFTPHVIFVKAGEDVSAKIMSFSQHGTRAVCILSANGAISNVTLRQSATSGGTVTYEGRFEILSLSGSFLLSENGGHRSRTGGLSVSLAGPDGRVLGGGVAGLLTAASPVQNCDRELQRRGKEGAKAAAEAVCSGGAFSGAGEHDAAGGGDGAEQPAVERHDEPERVVGGRPREPGEPGVHRRQPWPACRLLRPVLEMIGDRRQHGGNGREERGGRLCGNCSGCWS